MKKIKIKKKIIIIIIIQRRNQKLANNITHAISIVKRMCISANDRKKTTKD